MKHQIREYDTMLIYEEERYLPSFNSHVEAKAYFQKRYGNRFIIVHSSQQQNQQLFFGYLLLDNETTQPMIIFENGKVLFIH